MRQWACKRWHQTLPLTLEFLWNIPVVLTAPVSTGCRRMHSKFSPHSGVRKLLSLQGADMAPPTSNTGGHEGARCGGMVTIVSVL